MYGLPEIIAMNTPKYGCRSFKEQLSIESHALSAAAEDIFKDAAPPMQDFDPDWDKK